MWCSHQIDIHSLRLKRIAFIGPLEDCIGESFDKLFYFYFHDLFHFNSTVPSSMSMLTALQFLIFVDLPGLHGPFPIHLLANNEKLSMLVLTDTSLSGNFLISPLCESNKLNDLVISNNAFNPWTLPQCIGNMNRLQTVQFSGLDLYGTIPSGLCQSHSTLLHLGILNTTLSGSVPSCFSAFDRIIWIDIESNADLTGTFPRVNSSELRTLLLHHNGFQGAISQILPSNLSKLSKLEVATFHSNDFDEDRADSLIQNLFVNSPNLQALTLCVDDQRFTSTESSFWKR